MPPKKIGKYEVQQIIGEGSFGKVYLGVCDNEQYALKFIPKRSCQYKDIVKLKMEVDLLSKLKHLNIIHMK
jgi:serine/threonine protein kinase